MSEAINNDLYIPGEIDDLLINLDSLEDVSISF